jgi:hypothetical protein
MGMRIDQALKLWLCKIYARLINQTSQIYAREQEIDLKSKARHVKRQAKTEVDEWDYQLIN